MPKVTGARVRFLCHLQAANTINRPESQAGEAERESKRDRQREGEREGGRDEGSGSPLVGLAALAN